MSFSNSVEEEETEENMVRVESESSGEEPPMSEWSSLIFMLPKPNAKKALASEGLYSPGSNEICAKYMPMSDSDVAKHLLFQYSVIEDNGIREALNNPEPVIRFGNDGQEIYMAMCKEMNIAPIVTFYTGLLTDEIDLKYYGVNCQGVRAMAAALQNNTNVKSLNLKGNFLDNDACYHLGQMLRSNTMLERLSISACRVGKSGLLRICDKIKENSKLTTLNLSKNTLNDEGGIYIASVIKGGTPFLDLNLSKNGLGRQTALALSEAFDYYNNLIKFDISWNNLYQPPSTVKMIDSLANSIVLSELYLSWNAMEGDRIAYAIANVMICVPTISVIDLSNNRFEGKAINIIAANLTKAKKLHTLNLSSNPMTPADALAILQKLLLARVKIQTLLMDNVWVDKSFLEIKARVMRKKSRKHLKLTYAGAVGNYTITGPDPRGTVLKRADFLGQMNKKNPTDVGLFFLKLHKERPRPLILVKDLIYQAKVSGVPLNNDLIEEFAEVFPGPRFGKSKSVNLSPLVDYIYRIWPERKLPPTPPPELVEILPPVKPQPKTSPKGKK